MEGSVAGSALDALSGNSRAFYERTLDKTVWSLFAGIMSLVGLGFCAWAGGESVYFGSVGETVKDANDDNKINSYGAGYSGNAFASFCFFVSFAVYAYAAIYISPVLCGSETEKVMLKKPEELPSSSGGAGAEGY
jgi:hypothetical protein